MLFCAPLAATQADAQDVHTQEEETEPPPTYEATIERAVNEFQAGRFAEAGSLFRTAHALYPNARTLRGLGMSAFELRDYRTAYLSLNESLYSRVRPLTEEQHEAALTLRNQARQFVGVVTVRTVPTYAEVRVDGEEIDSHDIVLAIGRHELRVTAQGYQPERPVLEIAGGEERTVTFELIANPVAPPPPAAPEPVAPPPSHLPRALQISGATLFVAGSASMFWWRDRADAVEACDRSECDERGTLATRRNVALGVSLAGIAIGSGLAIVGALLDRGEPASSSSSEETSVMCAPSGLSVQCAASF